MVIERSTLDNIMVSFFKNVKDSKYRDIPIGRVLHGIGIGAYSDIINSARYCLTRNDEKVYKKIKEDLPAVTFCGTFALGHSADECTNYNNILVLDIDKLDDMQMSTVKCQLMDDPFVAAFWLSPSGRGYKGLVCLHYDDALHGIDLKDRHRMAFEQVFEYLLSHYDIALDKTGKDISRLCYMSSDENIVIKDRFSTFDIIQDGVVEENKEKKSSNIKVKSNHTEQLSWNMIYGKATGYNQNGYNRSLLTYIYKKLKKKNVSITENWENWVKVAFAIASSVHPEKGRQLFLDFCSLDGIKNDVAKSEKLIWDAYNRNLGKCSISTIIYLAKQKGIVLDR